MTYRSKIHALNEICMRLGGAGGHRQTVRALNEWSVRIGGAGGHVRTIHALNEICGSIGGSGGHARTIAALNEIARGLGGLGRHTASVGALDEILARLAPSGTGEAPAITGTPALVGTGLVGEPHTVAGYGATGTPAPEVTFAWRVGDVVVGTGAGYTPVAADEGAALTCTVRATSSAGTAAAVTPGVVVHRSLTLAERFAELNGGLPTYRHPDEAHVAAAGGRFDSDAGWTFPNNPGGDIAISGGVLTIPANPSLRLARHHLASPAAAGATFDVMLRRVSGTGGNLSVRLQGGGNNASAGTSQTGWLSAPITTTGNRTTLDIQLTGNFPAVIDNVSLRPSALAARRFHIISFAGQSNMVGASSGGHDPEIDCPHPRIWMMPGGTSTGFLQTAGVITQAHAPVQHRSFNGGIGPDLSFARYYAEHYLPEGHDVLVLACARGGSSLNPASGTWHPAGSNRSDHAACVADVLAALALNPANRYVAHVWSQGESDRGAQGAANYRSWFPAYVAAHRAETGVAVPVVMIGLNPAADTGDGIMLAMIAAQASLGLRGANAIPGVVHSAWRSHWGDGTKPAPDGPDDRVHFGAWANRLRGVQAAIDAAAIL